MINVPEIFSEMVFNQKVMRARLPKNIYDSLQQTIKNGKPLDNQIAGIIANAMKDWAVEKGATHFTHWFQPMTGFTAEKHDGFISPTSDGEIIMEFSGKELIKGEPDASSFPSGGLRATFEARGYTSWDPTSYAFVKDATLYIPTAFCAYGGEALDEKTPLLRSMEAINRQALRILRLFGKKNIKRVVPTVGAEQEYFLIDKKYALKRKDIMLTGRTLFGAAPPKSQETAEHYFCPIRPKVAEFMRELDMELWKLGIPAKTEHNETAPSQHELAPHFTTLNVAADHNQLIMDLMKKIADKHDFACLLHEKPFDGINGSGKHNNWSLAADDGSNLFEPGNSPYENAQFLLFLCAVIAAVDEHQDLLRISVATAGNDCRLGGFEAPTAIISMFLGDELTAVLNALADEMPYNAEISEELTVGTDVIPSFPKDATDRNRTSPFAFTGNKFEFRMVGSSMSIAEPNIILNTIVAEKLCEFADTLEKSEDFRKSLDILIKENIKKHRRIIFNGNNYSYEWLEEAKRRGLLNLATTPDALPCFASAGNIAMFEKHNIFSEAEVYSRSDILYGEYCKTICTEARTMSQMLRHEILPAASRFSKNLAETVNSKKAAFDGISCEYEAITANDLANLEYRLYKKAEMLDNSINRVNSTGVASERAAMCRDYIIPAMREARALADKIEIMLPHDYIPFPTYTDMLFVHK